MGKFLCGHVWSDQNLMVSADTGLERFMGPIHTWVKVVGTCAPCKQERAWDWRLGEGEDGMPVYVVKVQKL